MSEIVFIIYKLIQSIFTVYIWTVIGEDIIDEDIVRRYDETIIIV